MPTRARRSRTASIALVLAASVLVPGAALGATTISYSSVTGLLIQGDAAGDSVLVRAQPDVFDVDLKTAFTAGSGCTQMSAVVRCPVKATDNRVVTASLGDGADSFEITTGFETSDMFIDGGGGSDVIRGGFGTDFIDGGPGDDELLPSPGNDVVEGGDGNDVFRADVGGTMANTLRGEAGNDVLLSHPSLRSANLFDGGPGIDVADYSTRTTPVTLKVSLLPTPTPDDGAPGEGDDLDNVETLIGGSAGDTLEVRNLAFIPAITVHTLRGNGGADALTAVGSVRTVMDGGVGGDAVSGGAAGDVIFSREGERDLITCGLGLDTVRPDLRDQPLPANCENLDQSDRREDPNVTVLTRIARVDRAGVLNVRLTCPRSVRIGCRGTLVARLDRPATRFGAKVAYSLRRGRSTVLAVALPAGQVAGTRRPDARVRVRSVEAGVHGPKTTQRSLAARVG